MQKGLIKRVLESLDLHVGTANGKFTPAEGKPLSESYLWSAWNVHRDNEKKR